MTLSLPIFSTGIESGCGLNLATSARAIVERFVDSEIKHYRLAHRRSGLIKWLSNNEILSRAEKGAVSMEDRRDAENKIDREQSLRAVFQAISDGLVLIFIDEKPVADLDAELSLTPESQIAFVRLHTLRG